MSLRLCAAVFTEQRTVKVLSSEVLYCNCNVCKYSVNPVDEPADSFPSDQSTHKNMFNYSALYFISNK